MAIAELVAGILHGFLVKLWIGNVVGEIWCVHAVFGCTLTLLFICVSISGCESLFKLANFISLS